MPAVKDEPGVYSIESLDEAGCHLDQYELKQRLLELFRAPGYRPPLLPAVALELLAMTKKPRTSVAEVVALLGRDPMLAGQVLNLANSAIHSQGAQLRSLQDAVIRLGLARISDLFLQVSIEARVFRAPGFTDAMVSLRRHSAFTAEAARIVSQMTTGLDEYAFLCGLLHDVGIAACILALAGPLKELAPGGLEQAWPCVREAHAPCSEILTKLWGLPADVSLVVALHHEPAQGRHVHPLAAAVRLADSFADLAGFGFLTDGRPEHLRESADLLGLSDAEFSRLNDALGQLAAKLGAS